MVHFAAKDLDTLVTVNSHNMIEVWDLMGGGKIVRSWKGHASPISAISHHPISPLLLTGSADHGLRVWESERAYCTHSLQGVHGAMVTFVMFHPNPAILQVFSAAADGSIAVWDLHQTERPLKALHNYHSSAVTSLAVSPDGRLLLSVGRDKIANIWQLDAPGTNSKPIKTLPILETIEAAGFIDNQRIFTVGDKGAVRVWEVEMEMKAEGEEKGKGKKGEKQENKEKKQKAKGPLVKSSELLTSEGHSLVHALVLSKSSELVVATSDLYLYFLDIESLQVKRILAGHCGEITDVSVCGREDRLLAVGTNGPQVHLYRRDGGVECSLLRGHSQAVISLASGHGYLVSGSRDQTAIVWQERKLEDGQGENDSFSSQLSPPYQMVHTLGGHTDVVSAVAICKKARHGVVLIATASADCTIKMWRLEGGEEGRASLSWTIKAHEKDINSLIFTPNDKFLLSASQDKTVKVWDVQEGKELAILKGHRRGVWAMAVSPVEQILATASADRTIKIWSLSDFSCMKTVEGHASTVLKVSFLSGSSQLISAGSDGLLKIWDLARAKGGRSAECVNTLDGHDDRIWSMLLTDGDDVLITGDAKGHLKIWRDVTEEERLAAIAKHDELVLKEQELSNLILRRDYTNAVILAVQLEQPSRLLSLLGQLIDGRGMGEAVRMIADLLQILEGDQIAKILAWLRDWNVSLKRSYVSQLLLNALLKHRHTLLVGDPNMLQILAQIQPYTERHYGKLDDLLINAHLIDFVLDKIK